MHKFLAAAVAALMVSSSANAATIIGLCNTGNKQNCSQSKNGNGAELHWTLTGGPNPNAFMPTNIHPSWLANDATSRWIAPTNDGRYSPDASRDGLYAYALTFQIPSGFNPRSASFAGRFAVDNLVDSITLNGTTLAANGGWYNRWTGFGATNGFRSGLNTLTFNVRNQAQARGNPTGLRVEFSSSALAAVPEPATWAMMILGFGVVGGAMRRRKALGGPRLAPVLA